MLLEDRHSVGAVNFELSGLLGGSEDRVAQATEVFEAVKVHGVVRRNNQICPLHPLLPLSHLLNQSIPGRVSFAMILLEEQLDRVTEFLTSHREVKTDAIGVDNEDVDGVTPDPRRLLRQRQQYVQRLPVSAPIRR